MLPEPSVSRYISALDGLANFDRADGIGLEGGVIADAEGDLSGTGGHRRRHCRHEADLGVFVGTDLEVQLKGVESNVAQACGEGFNVTLDLDAMTDVGPEAHGYRVENVFRRLGETGMSREMVNRLATRNT